MSIKIEFKPLHWYWWFLPSWYKQRRRILKDFKLRLPEMIRQAMINHPGHDFSGNGPCDGAR